MPVELLLPGRKVPAPPMPSYVKLAEAFGVGAGTDLFDKSRYRSHGAITGAAWAAGVHGFCLDFNPATPSYVLIPAAHTQLNFIADDFSIIARIYVDDLTIHRSVFVRGVWDDDGWLFTIRSAGQMRFMTFQALANQFTQSAAADIVIGTWYTVGFSRAGANARVYRNGVDVTAVPGVHINPATCARSAKIGIWDDVLTQPFDGKIEFLRVFGGIALAASEHLAWHNALV